LSHIYAQIIDDAVGNTLVAASSLESEVASKGNGGSKQEVSRLVGALIGQRAKDKGVKRVIMDRGGCKYHGRIKALADAARKEGLDF
jgi:large subunit ribosomal protein L18